MDFHTLFILRADRQLLQHKKNGKFLENETGPPGLQGTYMAVADAVTICKYFALDMRCVEECRARLCSEM